jgi:hypothetical protein
MAHPQRPGQIRFAVFDFAIAKVAYSSEAIAIRFVLKQIG